MLSRRFLSSIALLVVPLGAVVWLALIVTQGAASPAISTQLTGPPTSTPVCTPYWAIVPSPNITGNARLFAMTGSGNDIWAVGSYGSGGVVQTLTMHWDGAAWTVVPSPNANTDSNELFGVTGSGNDVWAVGDYWNYEAGYHVTDTLILHWDGTSWSVVPSPSPAFWVNRLLAATGSGHDVWAVGTYNGPDQHGWTFTLHWDGTSWAYVQSPNAPAGGNEELLAVTGTGNDVWAVGDYNFFGQVILHWNGTIWTYVPGPTPGFSVNSLSGVSGSGNDVWAVGVYDIPGDIYRTLTLHWNGTSWTHVTSPNIDTNQHELVAVSGSGNDVWAIGNHRDASGYDRTLTLHWDGTSWTLIPSPDPGAGPNDITAISAHGSDVWSVGNTSPNCCFPQPLTLRWDTQCGPGTPTPVSTSTNTAQPANTATHTTTPSPTRTPGTPSPTPTAPSTPTIPATPAAATSTSTRSTPTAPPTSTTPPGETATPTPTTCTLTFADVLHGSTFYPYIQCLACRGIVGGYPGGLFHPSYNVTRGQIAKIVSNSAGFSDPQTNQTFEDVPVGSTFHIFVERLASRGIISGYPCGGPGEPCVSPANQPYFRPGGSATRGQLMKIDVEVAIDILGWTLLDPPSNTFQDVPTGSTFFRHVETAYAHTVAQGYACGGPGEPCFPPENRPYFRPSSSVTRGQTSKIVSNTFFPNCQPSRR